MTASTVVARFAAIAAARPGHDAIVGPGDARLAYGALLDRVRRTAAALAADGVGADDRVALIADNGPDYVAAYYGCLWLGAIVVPLNGAARAGDLANWTRHAGARLVLIGARHRERAALEGTLADSVPMREVDTLHAASEPIARDPAVEPEAVATIIYTSGTTGAPKGVTLTHANLEANTAAIVDYLGLRADDRTLCVLPFYYSYGNSLLHTHLTTGAALHLENALLYPQRLLARFAAEAITGFAGVPSTFALLLDRTQLEQVPVPNLRYVTQAGGAMSAERVDRVRAAWPRARFFVMYGQTEATARIAWLPPEAIESHRGSVGVPIADTEIEIRDEADALLPPGRTGEVCVRGPGVMQGYWNAPELTAQVLRDGWLHTGDLGWLDREGYLYLEGRSTDMIKSGAHRIAPADIEEVLERFAGVAEAAVVGIPDETLGQVVRAVVVPHAPGTLDTRALLRHCREQLAQYKIPKEILTVDALPKTASGKIQRARLREQGV